MLAKLSNEQIQNLASEAKLYLKEKERFPTFQPLSSNLEHFKDFLNVAINWYCTIIKQIASQISS